MSCGISFCPQLVWGVEITFPWSALRNWCADVAEPGSKSRPGPAATAAASPSAQVRCRPRHASSAANGERTLRVPRSAFVLRSPAEELVHGLKYGGWAELAGLMGRRMARRAIPPSLASVPYLVVPVPTTKRRLRTRGYNQAYLLAVAVSGEVGRPLHEALERRHGGSTQVGLHPTQRRANVKKSFTVRDDTMVVLSGARVLLSG